MRDELVFSTERLEVFIAGIQDLDLYDELWHEPMVMQNVGFPKGLPITRDEISDLLRKQKESGKIFNVRLVIILRATGEKIGEAKLGAPQPDGISEPDTKLLPAFWGNAYGREVMGAVIRYIFEHSDAKIIQTTPRITNIGSHKMIEAFGGVRMYEDVFEVGGGETELRKNVPFYCYQLTRDVFEAQQK